jgi:hypothetical protein
MKVLGFKEQALPRTAPQIKVVFWIRSSRGTNRRETVILPRGTPADEKQHLLEAWCSQFGAWHVSENFVRYGWRYA